MLFGPVKQVRGITDSALPQGKGILKLFLMPHGVCFLGLSWAVRLLLPSILQGMLFVLGVCVCDSEREVMVLV